jgi:hypothetical protein
VSFNDSYATLQTAIGDWANRGDLPVEDLITLTEAMLRRSDALQDEVRTTIELNANIVALPAACGEVLHLFYDDGVRFGPIDIKPPDTVAALKPTLPTSGAPQLAAIVENGTKLFLAPDPDDTYTAEIIYLANLTSLSDQNTSNWILASHGDLYLYGALLKAEPYLKNDERIPVWKEMFDVALVELRQFLERKRYSANTLSRRPRRALGEV